MADDDVVVVPFERLMDASMATTAAIQVFEIVMSTRGHVPVCVIWHAADRGRSRKRALILRSLWKCLQRYGDVTDMDVMGDSVGGGAGRRRR
jgi:hypothetical protein